MIVKNLCEGSFEALVNSGRRGGPVGTQGTTVERTRELGTESQCNLLGHLVILAGGHLEQCLIRIYLYNYLHNIQRPANLKQTVSWLFEHKMSEDNTSHQGL